MVQLVIILSSTLHESELRGHVKKVWENVKIFGDSRELNFIHELSSCQDKPFLVTNSNRPGGINLVKAFSTSKPETI